MDVLGKFLGCIKAVKDPLEAQERRWDFSPMPSGKGPHLALRGESPGFSQVTAGNLVFLMSYDGDLRDPLVWPQESPVSMRVARSLSGFLSSQCRVLGPHLELRSEPQASSQVLTWNSEFRWSFNRVSGLVSCTNM